MRIVIEERAHIPWWVKVLVPIFSVLVALLINSILIIYAGANPLKAYYYILTGSLGTEYSITETFVKMSPLLLNGLAVAVAFTAKFWNIGMEGQMYAGAIASIWAALTFKGLPAVLHLPLVIVCGLLAGALWGAFAGYLKVKFDANEVVTTIMLNYIMILLCGALVHGPWRDPVSFWPSSPAIPDSASFPVLLRGTRFHLGIVIAIAVAFLVHILMKHTTWGYEIKAVGANFKAARYGGIDAKRAIILTTFISGALAGLAGVGEAIGVQHKLLENFSPGYGYMGVGIGLLGGLHPLGVLVASFFFAALITGSEMMQRATGVSIALTYALQGIVLIVVLGMALLTQYRIRLVRREYHGETS